MIRCLIPPLYHTNIAQICTRVSRSLKLKNLFIRKYSDMHSNRITKTKKTLTQHGFRALICHVQIPNQDQ
ncbi:MAG: hypothetical protein JWM44_4435 [Bacilli bacterium]|nr:hypothetical protein [Bacilli bacterium]